MFEYKPDHVHGAFRSEGRTAIVSAELALPCGFLTSHPCTHAAEEKWLEIGTQNGKNSIRDVLL